MELNERKKAILRSVVDAYIATGEPVQGVCYVPSKPYTQLRPKSLDLVNDAARAIYGSTPMALLEGGTDGQN